MCHYSSSLVRKKSTLLRPDFVEHLHEAVVDHEGDGHVQADPGHPGDGSLVEGLGSLFDHDLASAVQRVLVPGCLQALHPLGDKKGRELTKTLEL